MKNRDLGKKSHAFYALNIAEIQLEKKGTWSSSELNTMRRSMLIYFRGEVRSNVGTLCLNFRNLMVLI